MSDSCAHEDPKTVQILLQAVIEGNVYKAANILLNNPSLAFIKGSIADPLSKETYENVTAIDLARIYLHYEMLSRIIQLNISNREKIIDQLREFPFQDRSCCINNFLDACDNMVKNFSSIFRDPDAFNEAFRAIAVGQRTIPMHFLYRIFNKRFTRLLKKINKQHNMSGASFIDIMDEYNAILHSSIQLLFKTDACIKLCRPIVAENALNGERVLLFVENNAAFISLTKHFPKHIENETNVISLYHFIESDKNWRENIFLPWLRSYHFIYKKLFLQTEQRIEELITKLCENTPHKHKSKTFQLDQDFADLFAQEQAGQESESESETPFSTTSCFAEPEQGNEQEKAPQPKIGVDERAKSEEEQSSTLSPLTASLPFGSGSNCPEEQGTKPLEIAGDIKLEKQTPYLGWTPWTPLSQFWPFGGSNNNLSEPQGPQQPKTTDDIKSEEQKPYSGWNPLSQFWPFGGSNNNLSEPQGPQQPEITDNAEQQSSTWNLLAFLWSSPQKDDDPKTEQHKALEQEPETEQHKKDDDPETEQHKALEQEPETPQSTISEQEQPGRPLTVSEQRKSLELLDMPWKPPEQSSGGLGRRKQSLRQK